jgi:AhpD family alkylhydroperoxidase
MSDEVKAFFQKFQRDVGKMQKELPEVVKSFMGLFETVMKDGALSVKQKELIALATGLTIQCGPCIRLHVKKSLDAGATREEILETASVVVMMQGGPAYTHIPEVMDALEACGK